MSIASWPNILQVGGSADVFCLRIKNTNKTLIFLFLYIKFLNNVGGFSGVKFRVNSQSTHSQHHHNLVATDESYRYKEKSKDVK